MTVVPLDPPFWSTIAVFDPDGQGRDFAYTSGLVPQAPVKLHLWARPSLGTDPGLDWKLSTRDCGLLLDEAAGELLADRLGPRSVFVKLVDRGRTRLTFEVGQPAGAYDLDTWSLDPDITVLPLRWSLTRAVDGNAQ